MLYRKNLLVTAIVVALIVSGMLFVYFVLLQPQEFQTIAVVYDGQTARVSAIEKNKSAGKPWPILQPTPALSVRNTSNQTCAITVSGQSTNESATVAAGNEYGFLTTREQLTIRVCDQEVVVDAR